MHDRNPCDPLHPPPAFAHCQAVTSDSPRTYAAEPLQNATGLETCGFPGPHSKTAGAREPHSKTAGSREPHYKTAGSGNRTPKPHVHGNRTTKPRVPGTELQNRGFPGTGKTAGSRALDWKTAVPGDLPSAIQRAIRFGRPPNRTGCRESNPIRCLK